MQSVAVLLVFGFIASVLAADAKFRPRPNCNCDGLTCECCVGFTFRKEAKSVCLKTRYNPNELTMNADLILDGNILSTKTIGPDFIPFCVPVPATPGLTLCLSARKVYFSMNEAKVCTALEVKLGLTRIFKTNLPCFKKTDGQLFITKN